MALDINKEDMPLRKRQVGDNDCVPQSALVLLLIFCPEVNTGSSTLTSWNVSKPDRELHLPAQVFKSNTITHIYSTMTMAQLFSQVIGLYNI